MHKSLARESCTDRYCLKVLVGMGVILQMIAHLGIGRTSNSLEVVVTASPLPTPIEAFGRFSETVAVTPARDISVADVLEHKTSVSVRQRGRAQRDLSIRGSSFQQVLLTLNGIPLKDSQTSHHDMNLPFPEGIVDTITVIPGPGSSLFGPRALAGVVDIQTIEPASSDITVSSALGSFETRRAEAVAKYSSSRYSSLAAVSHETSKGFVAGTDYDMSSAWISTTLETENGSIPVSAGHADRDFGAHDFYAPYPSRERTRTTLFDTAPRLRLSPAWSVKTHFRYRRNEDDFILIEDNPSFYKNQHTTETFLERIVVSHVQSDNRSTAAGVERSDTFLNSSNLGERDRETASAFLQHNLTIRPIAATAGLRFDDSDEWGSRISPSASMSIPLSREASWRASVSRGIRPPDLTELYYTDPQNVGNPQLGPEEAWGGETGIDWLPADDLDFSVTYFIRDTKDLIDWTRDSPDKPWRAANVGNVQFQGAEAGANWQGRTLTLNMKYTYIDTYVDSAPAESKYALNVPRNEMRGGVVWETCPEITVSSSVLFREIPSLDSYTLLRTHISHHAGPFTIFANGQNMLNEQYEEIPGVPTPGRYIELGISTTL
jgi:iron complex outermembrane receptor protein